MFFFSPKANNCLVILSYTTVFSYRSCQISLVSSFASLKCQVSCHVHIQQKTSTKKLVFWSPPSHSNIHLKFSVFHKYSSFISALHAQRCLISVSCDKLLAANGLRIIVLFGASLHQTKDHGTHRSHMHINCLQIRKMKASWRT